MNIAICDDDIYILDVMMPHLNGIEVGFSSRDAGFDGKIIYLTSSEKHAIDAFKTRAFHYLLKPIERESLFSALEEVSSVNSSFTTKNLLVKTKDGNRFVLCGASTVINLHLVTLVENDAMQFHNDSRLYIGRRVGRELRSVWSEFWSET